MLSKLDTWISELGLELRAQAGVSLVPPLLDINEVLGAAKAQGIVTPDATIRWATTEDLHRRPDEGGLRALARWWCQGVLLARWVQCSFLDSDRGWVLVVQCPGGVECFYGGVNGSWNFLGSRVGSHHIYPGGPQKSKTFWPDMKDVYFVKSGNCRYSKRSERHILAAGTRFSAGAMIAVVEDGQLALGAPRTAGSNGETLFTRGVLEVDSQSGFDSVNRRGILIDEKEPGRVGTFFVTSSEMMVGGVAVNVPVVHSSCADDVATLQRAFVKIDVPGLDSITREQARRGAVRTFKDKGSLAIGEATSRAAACASLANNNH
jgi:hypothetical protein